MRLHWTPDLSVKNDKIDKEHQRWIELFNNFYSGITDGKSEEQLEELILGMLDYTNYHFSSEEQFMQSLDYPNLDKHKIEHEFFIKKTEEIYKKLSKREIILSLEAINPLKTWLTNHIKEVDLQYAHFAEEKNNKINNLNFMITWTPEFSVDIPELDKEHQFLFSSLNDFYEGLRQGTPKENLSKLITNLVNYTQMHFAHEEEVMKTIQFPDLENHKKEHLEYIEKVTEFQNEFNEGKLIFSLEVTAFLKDWIINHILIEDQKFRSYVKK